LQINATLPNFEELAASATHRGVTFYCPNKLVAQSPMHRVTNEALNRLHSHKSPNSISPQLSAASPSTLLKQVTRLDLLLHPQRRKHGGFSFAWLFERSNKCLLVDAADVSLQVATKASTSGGKRAPVHLPARKG